ncbi:Disease resistance protein RPP13 [Camellia lanceoleosa]|uniref:Disease resistance protein RPP13 n=1 Tax=Camellia lanceoleosa TaxID=1840588 RepID=A0ACC0IBW6_9ERIC|nr:Disease resistance protein RPP13 [Camellia lanceoleosa]
MAEIAIAIAIAVLRQAVGLLGNLIIQEGSHLFKLKDDMEWIENEMGYIQAYLEDADNDNSMQIESKVEAELLKNIRLLAFDVEDIVETYFPHIASSHERTRCLRSWLNCVNCILCHGSASHKCATEIEGIRRRVENIPRVRNAYESRSGGSSSGDIWEKRKHNLHRDEPIVVGFDEHIKTLEAKLLDPDLKNRVVSIVGMPGLGKTTLAKKVFDSVTTHVNEEEHQFQCSAKLPNQIGNLRHLRYFRCEHRSIKLPLTMGKLKNLTTLDIQIGHCIHIPKAIWEMEQLRHIVVDKRSIQWPPQDCRDLVRKYSFRQTEVSLPNLQTLYVVPGRLLEAEWLHKCPNLRKLGISNPPKSIIKVLSEEAPVSNKLEILRLSVNHRYENEEATLTKLDLSRYESLRKLHLQIPMGKFLELGKLPLNLIKLTLVNAYLVEDPLVTLKELPKLNILKLGSLSYTGKKMVCLGGPDKFPQLEVLEIDLYTLDQLVVEEDGMPRLKKLSYKHCNAELMIPERIKSIMIVI